MLNEVLAEGTTYPFEGPMDEAMFRAYFLSHDAFVARTADTAAEVQSRAGRKNPPTKVRSRISYHSWPAFSTSSQTFRAAARTFVMAAL
jgi:hypothetical protein